MLIMPPYALQHLLISLYHLHYNGPWSIPNGPPDTMCQTLIGPGPWPMNGPNIEPLIQIHSPTPMAQVEKTMLPGINDPQTKVHVRCPRDTTIKVLLLEATIMRICYFY